MRSQDMRVSTHSISNLGHPLPLYTSEFHHPLLWPFKHPHNHPLDYPFTFGYHSRALFLKQRHQEQDDKGWGTLWPSYWHCVAPSPSTASPSATTPGTWPPPTSPPFSKPIKPIFFPFFLNLLNLSFFFVVVSVWSFVHDWSLWREKGMDIMTLIMIMVIRMW